tara:strand:- start:910 stop:1281 length:372 start_codon:yes stop_codon:yes gene_type:complete
MSVSSSLHTLIDNASGVTSSECFRVSDHEIVTIRVETSNNADLTVFLRGDINASGQPDQVTAPVGAYDYNTALVISGDQGLVYAGQNGVKLYNFNVDRVDWLQVFVAGYTAGNVSVQVKMFNN